MQIRFSALLTTILWALLIKAVPTPNSKSGIVTLPLNRVAKRSDLHPLVAHQQNVNRSHRRLARMTGRSEPTYKEMRESLRKRIFSIDGDGGLERRYNRVGVPPKSKAASSGSLLSSKVQKTKGNTGNTTAAASDQPDSVTSATPPTADNSLGLDIEANDIGYLATVQMGTPPRDFLLLMDSGSSDLWVGGESCQSEAGGGCGNHQFLGAESSSSFQDTQKPFSVTYGTGQVSGTIVQDNIVVAGLALKGHNFGVTTTESVEFSDNATPFDGLMGLAQSTLSEQGVLTPIEAMAKAGLVKNAITSYKLARFADNDNDGEITFGGLDNTKFDPQTLVTLKNINRQGFWEGDMDAITVDGQDSGLQGRTAILDTGTTLIIAPQNDAVAIHKSIDGAKDVGQGTFTVPCTTKAKVAIKFGGTVFTIDPRDIAFQPADPNDPTGDCISGIAAGQIGASTEWLVGDVFLKNAYFSTDVTKNTLSLATLA